MDCAIEAVGIESTWNICQNVVKEGGHLANVGVHGKSVNFSIEKLWIKNLTITTRLVNANTTGMPMKTCCSDKLPMNKLVTHHFKFAETEKAYDVFMNVAKEKAMKVIIEI
jgi:alcohol dehydrogenase